MAIPVSYSEIYSNKPADSQFSELISSFKTEPTFLSLAMWNLMLSLYEDDGEKYKYLQGFFIHNLIKEDRREQVLHAAALQSESPRPVFGRWQLLALMKRVLLETTSEGNKDPRRYDGARRTLGEACLMLNDLLFTEEQMARLDKTGDAGERERIHDELMTQWFPQSELIHVPDVFQAIARNDEYINIFDRRAVEFSFSEGQSLAQRFKQLTGLDIGQYLRLYFAIYILHNELQDKHPDEINANPGIINFDRERMFSNMDFETEEKNIFFRQAITDLPSLIEGVRKDVDSGRAWQFDFTTFRDHPLVSIPGNKQGFTCIAFPFLIEKLASGIYHTILNSWEEGDPERDRFQSYWGKVFEQFVNDRLSEEYPSTILAKQFYPNPYFNKKRNRSIEVCDAVLDYGDSLVLMEHKGGYLSLDEKYSDDANRLLTGVAAKFGLDKAIKQLSRSVGMLFNAESGERDTFSELGEKRRPIHSFNTTDVERIRKVYPVLVVQDFSMTTGFMNRRLRLQFAQKLQESRITPNVHILPLSLLTVENLENILEHLEEIRLTDFLDEYAGEQQQPLSTFNDILDKYLEARGSDKRRRYKWSVARGQEFLKSIMQKFIIDE
jgi:hypothetical protein